jgi:putative flippase GtrA
MTAYKKRTKKRRSKTTEQTKDKVKLTKKQNFLQGLKFLLFSCSAGVIQAATFTLLNETIRWDYWPSYLIALTLSVLYNFTVNRRFTFKSAKNVPLAMMQVIGYYLVFTPLSTWWGEALTRAGWNEYIVLFGTMVVNLVTEFSFYRFVVYRNHLFTNKAGQRELAKMAESETTEAEASDRLA